MYLTNPQYVVRSKFRVAQTAIFAQGLIIDKPLRENSGLCHARLVRSIEDDSLFVPSLSKVDHTYFNSTAIDHPRFFPLPW